MLDKVTGSGFKIKHEGKEYTLSPVSVGALGEFVGWAKNLPFDDLAERVEQIEKHGLPCSDEMKEGWVQEAVELSKELEHINKPACQALMQDIRGVRFILWQSLKVKHPDMTQELAESLVTVEALQGIQAKLDNVSGLGDKGPKKNPT